MDFYKKFTYILKILLRFYKLNIYLESKNKI